MFDFLQYTMQILSDKVRILFYVSCTLLLFTFISCVLDAGESDSKQKVFLPAEAISSSV